MEPPEYLARPYSTSHFIHSWVDLAGLRFDEFDPAKSIVNAGFKPVRLLIGNPHVPASLRDFNLLPSEPREGSDVQVAQHKSSK